VWAEGDACRALLEQAWEWEQERGNHWTCDPAGFMWERIGAALQGDYDSPGTRASKPAPETPSSTVQDPGAGTLDRFFAKLDDDHPHPTDDGDAWTPPPVIAGIAFGPRRVRCDGVEQSGHARAAHQHEQYEKRKRRATLEA